MANSPIPAPPIADAGASVPSLRTLGTGANQAAAGNDSRFGTPSNATATPTAAGIPISDGASHLAPGWLESGVVQVDTLTALKALTSTSRFSHFRYKTLGCSSVNDGGDDEYEWRAASTSTPDDAFVVKPNDITLPAAGRFHYLIKSGVFRAAAGGIISSNTLDQGLRLKALIDSCKTYGATEIHLPPGKIDIRGYSSQKSLGLQSLKIKGAGKNKTFLTGAITVATRKANVRLATAAALPSCTAAGSGAGKTLTATANGALSVDGTAVANGDRILVKNQVTRRDNGIYVVTQAGSGGTPFILTRATDFNSTNTCTQRSGVSITAGATHIYQMWVVSKLDNGYYNTTQIVPDTDDQYWTQESFIPTSLEFFADTEMSWFTINAQEPIGPRRWTYWHNAGDKTLPNVQFLAGGSYSRVSDSTTYTLQPINVGDKIVIMCGGTPSDQGVCYQHDLVTVMAIDANNNVTIDKPIRQKAPYIAGTGGAIDNYGIGAGTYPPYSLNEVRHHMDNQYWKVTSLASDIEMCDLTLDGITINWAFVERPWVHDIVMNNIHAGVIMHNLYQGVFERIEMNNLTGFNLGYPSGAGAWYGFGFIANACNGTVYRDITVNGMDIACFLDVEVESETVWDDITINLSCVPNGVGSVTLFVTTPNVTHRNVLRNITIRGSTAANVLALTEPCHNLTYDADNQGGPGLFCNTSKTTGRIRIKGREYGPDRTAWRCKVPLSPSTNVVIPRPIDGLWSNTRIYMSTLTGVSAVLVTPVSIGAFDIISYLSVGWTPLNFNIFDTLAAFYPNGSYDDHQSITIYTDGTLPAGAYCIIESSTITQVDRGDAYMDVEKGTISGLTPAATGAGAPSSSATLIGQLYYNTSAQTWYESYRTGFGAGDWVAAKPLAAPLNNTNLVDEVQGSGAPSINATIVGQLYFDYTNSIWYESIKTGSGAGDWLQKTAIAATAAPSDIAGAAATGTAVQYARRDHVHTIGSGVVTGTMIANTTITGGKIASATIDETKLTFKASETIYDSNYAASSITINFSANQYRKLEVVMDWDAGGISEIALTGLAASSYNYSNVYNNAGTVAGTISNNQNSWNIGTSAGATSKGGIRFTIGLPPASNLKTFDFSNADAFVGTNTITRIGSGYSSDTTNNPTALVITMDASRSGHIHVVGELS